jgi:hypothetical protein
MDLTMLAVKLLFGKWGPSYETIRKIRYSEMKSEMKTVTDCFRKWELITPGKEVIKGVKSYLKDYRHERQRIHQDDEDDDDSYDLWESIYVFSCMNRALSGSTKEIYYAWADRFAEGKTEFYPPLPLKRKRVDKFIEECGAFEKNIYEILHPSALQAVLDEFPGFDEQLEGEALTDIIEFRKQDFLDFLSLGTG